MPGFAVKCLIVLIAMVCCANSAFAQRERDGDRGGRRRFDPSEWIKRMDENGNGQLEPGEVSDRGRRFVDEAATKAGLDPKQPLPIDKLVAAMQQRDDEDDKPKEGDTAPMPMTEGTKTETPMPGTTPATPPAETKPAAPSSVVIGFGSQTTRTPPPGFGPLPTDGKPGDKKSTSSSSRGSTGGSSTGSRTGSTESSDRREQVQKVRRYAEGLMKQYDENKNGVLEKDEWKKMRGDPEKADANDDNIITTDELADRLANYGSDGGRSENGGEKERERGGDKREERREDRGGRSRDKESASADKKSFRFLTPTERLPKGLPTWFARNDANADGQVTMFEYSTSYNETTAAEFAKYDLDGDGIITPQECLQAESKAKASPKTSSITTSSGSGSSSAPPSGSSERRFGR